LSYQYHTSQPVLLGRRSQKRKAKTGKALPKTESKLLRAALKQTPRATLVTVFVSHAEDHEGIRGSHTSRFSSVHPLLTTPSVSFDIAQVSYVAHYKDAKDWSSYQPMKPKAGDAAAQTVRFTTRVFFLFNPSWSPSCKVAAHIEDNRGRGVGHDARQRDNSRNPSNSSCRNFFSSFSFLFSPSKKQGLSGSLVKKKKAPPGPSKETARAYSQLPPPNRTGGNKSNVPAAPAVMAGKTDEPDAEPDASPKPEEGGEMDSTAEPLPLVEGGDPTEDSEPLPGIANPSPPEMDVVQKPPMTADDASHQAVAFRLRRELYHLRHRAEQEMAGRDHEIDRLKGQVALLREKITSQSVELKDGQRALGEVKRENAAEVSMCRREGALAERRASSMQARLGAAASNSERVFASANAQLEATKGERNTLAQAMAEIASAVVGGAGVTREELALDAEAAVAEGSDPLPKRTDSWLQYSYSVDGNQGGRSGHGGERAIRSLVASVSRLHRRCKDAHASEQKHRGLLQELEEALNGMTTEYNAVEVATMALFDHAISMQQLCGGTVHVESS
jgi:hypothetical protein